MTPRTVLILCERAPVKVNPVPAVRYGLTEPRAGALRKRAPGSGSASPRWECSWCGRRVQVVA